MWSFDNWVIDGLVNGIAKLTILWSDLKLWFDTWIVDGAVNGTGWIVQQGSSLLRFVQAGAVQFYALFLLIAMILLALVKFEVVMVTVDWPVLSVILLAGVALLAVVSRAAHRAGPAEVTADTGTVGVEKEE